MSEQIAIHVLAGPTASGKSALGLSKAHELDGIIINADSMQVYDALPILTAQPSEAEKNQIGHKLYGALHPSIPCSAGKWRGMAIDAIRQALDDGKTPIVVGGSGLYIKALIEGFSPIPDVPPEIRAHAAALYEKAGGEAFHRLLKERDPDMAGRFHPNHSARLIRAYEILEATGRSLAEYQAMPKEVPPAGWHFHITLVMPDKRELDARCDARFDWMIDHGAIEEVDAFMARTDIKEGALIHKALGLEPLIGWRSGKIGKDEAVARAKSDTRRYAKRQMTWFRHQVAAAGNNTISRLE